AGFFGRPCPRWDESERARWSIRSRGTTSEVNAAPRRPSLRRIRRQRRGRSAVPRMVLGGALQLAAFRPRLLVGRLAWLLRGTRPLPDMAALVASFHALRLGGRRDGV